MSRRPKTEVANVENRVEELRTKRNISRQELADLVNVHYQTMSYIERGEYSPSLGLALQIADALKTPIDEIFWLVKEKS